MRARYVGELAEGARVDCAFILRSKEMKAARNGDAYLSMTLIDRTGSIRGVLFRPCGAASASPVGSVVNVQGTVTRFNGVKRLSVESMLPAVTWSPEDFLPTSNRPADELAVDFGTLVRSVADQSLRALLLSVFGDREVFSRFSACPASAHDCRPYLGGLIEHTIQVSSICSDIAEKYAIINRDELVVAALLHDVGMIDELDHETVIVTTDVGRLLGHVELGLRRIQEHGQRLHLDSRLLDRIQHAVLTHHERDAIGGRRPCTPEAIMLAHADRIERESEALGDALHGAALVEERWTGSENAFSRPLLSVAAAGATDVACIAGADSRLLSA